MASVTDLCSSLQGQRVRETDRQREREMRPGRHGDVLLIFCVQRSVHCVIYDNNYSTRCNNIRFIYICKLLYMFRLVSPPAIISSYHCVYRPLLLLP
jgi:hypothetical protein